MFFMTNAMTEVEIMLKTNYFLAILKGFSLLLLVFQITNCLTCLCLSLFTWLFARVHLFGASHDWGRAAESLNPSSQPQHFLLLSAF